MDIIESRKIPILALRKKLLEHFTAIYYFKLNNYIKNKGFWKVLERIISLYTNSDGHSYIRDAFTKLRSEKKHSDDSIRKSYTEVNFHISCARKY